MSRHIFDTSDPVKKIGERALISRILSAYGDTCPPAPRGGGDDCAVFGRDTLFKHNYITVDSLVYGRHFDDSCTAAEAGAKLLKRNISDIASMGGVPQRAVIAAVISGDVSASWLEDFARGLAAVARQYNIEIIGGDISDSGADKFFSMSLTLLGGGDTPPLLRSNAHSGDILYTTGKLGYSLETRHHLLFTPRIPQGLWLAKWNASTIIPSTASKTNSHPAEPLNAVANSNLVNEMRAKITSCTDISDGLAIDIKNVLAPDCIAVLDFVPVREFCGKRSVEKALCDGEDYELLFSLSAPTPQSAADFEAAYLAAFPNLPLYRIGRVIAAEKRLNPSKEQNAEKELNPSNEKPSEERNSASNGQTVEAEQGGVEKEFCGGLLKLNLDSSASVPTDFKGRGFEHFSG